MPPAFRAPTPDRGAPQTPDRTFAGARRVVAEVALALAISAVALAVRLPELQQIPRFTDEVAELAGALEILHEGARPLVDVDSYRGPLWSYSVATALAATGSRPEVPRLLAALLGSLTVGATYLLGRVASGRTAGLVAALLMTTAFSHIALNSHVAWSNNTTPLWTTLAVAFLALGTRERLGGRRPGIALVASGVLWGLALHTHPSVVALLAGAVLWYLAAPARRARLRTPAPWLAGAAFLVVVSPMVAFNLQNGFAALAEATAPSQPIARDHGPAAIARNLAGLAGQLGRMAGGGRLPEPGDPVPTPLVGWTDAARPLATILYAALLLGALARAAWRGPRLVAATAGAAIVLLPLVNASYLNFYDTRYLAYLLPLAYVAVGHGAAPRLAPTSPWQGSLLFGLVGLALYPLLSLGAFYQREAAAGRTNTPIVLVAGRLLAQASRPGSHVFVDKALRDLDLGGGGDPARAFDQLLTLLQVPHDLSDVDELRWFFQEDPDTAFWVIAATSTAETLEAEFALGERVLGDGWVVVERTGSPPRPDAAPAAHTSLLSVAESLSQRARGPDQALVVDGAVRDLGEPGTRTWSLLGPLLDLYEVPFTISDASDLRWLLANDDHTDLWLIVVDPTADALAADFGLRTRDRGDGWRLLHRPGPTGPTARPLAPASAVRIGREVQAMSRRAAAPGRFVFVDKALSEAAAAFRPILQLHQVPYQASEVDELRWFLLHDVETTFTIVAAETTARQLAEEFELVRRAEGPGWVVLERPGRP